MENNPLWAIDPTGEVALVDDLAIAGAAAALTCAVAKPCREAIGNAMAATAKAVGNAASTAATAISKACQEKNNPCQGQPSRTQAFMLASIYAGMDASWKTIGWDQFNKPRTRNNQIEYAKFRQKIGNDPYGYRSANGGEIVEHPADTEHPCPYFHAKSSLSASAQVFPYDPEKP